MTAINPARLKMQTAELGELAGQPELFVLKLHELLGFYSARIRQTSLSKTPLSLQAYQVAQPVIRVLEAEIAEQIEDDPKAGFCLVDALWKEDWVEFRRLAVTTLGILPTQEPGLIIERADVWLNDCTAEDIRRWIMTAGLSRLREEQTEQVLKFLEELISNGSKADHQAALFGLESYAKDESYPNMPLLYKYLTQILLVDEKGLVKEISTVLQILAARSEQETVYFLLKQILSAHKPRIFRVIRSSLNSFSRDNQQLLKQKMENSR